MISALDRAGVRAEARARLAAFARPAKAAAGAGGRTEPGWDEF